MKTDVQFELSKILRSCIDFKKKNPLDHKANFFAISFFSYINNGWSYLVLIQNKLPISRDSSLILLVKTAATETWQQFI